MPSEAEILAMLDAGDALADDLNVLLSTEMIEGAAVMLGLEVNAHMEAWELASAAISPRL